MAFGLTPARGPWEYRPYTTASAATFVKGCLVSLNPARTLREYASTHSSALGIALNDSANSLPQNIVVVAIPYPGCTAYADLDTGVARSLLSNGQVGTIAKVGNFMSFASVSGSFSAFSSLIRIISEPLADQSRASRVEVSFILDNFTEYGSTSTSTFAS